MSLWRQLSRGLRALGNPAAADREIDDEVSHYLDEATAAFVDRGFSPDEARRAARLELGGATAVRQQVRSYGWEKPMENLFADLRHAARRLAGNPGFTAVSVLTLAIGIGASAAIFSVVDAVLLRALPYPNPEQIVRVWERARDGHGMNLAGQNLNDFRAQNNTLVHFAGYGYGLGSIAGGSEPVRVNIAIVSKGFFETLGVAPFRGRTFSAEEQRLHGSPAAIVGYGCWQRYLGGAADLSRSHLRLEGRVYSVVGVMPEGFDFPSSVSLWISSELDADESSRTAHNWRGLGRLRDGVSVAQARADLDTIGRRLRQQYGKSVDLDGALVRPLADAMVGNVRTALLTMSGAVGLLLLVACTNVAGLLLARTSARSKELALCAALGAGRGRLVQQFLAESFLLAGGGCLVGIAIAAWAVKMLPAILPLSLPRQQGIAMNLPVLLFAIAGAVAVAVALGLFSAWRAVSGDLQRALNAGSRSYSGGADSRRFRGFLVMGEIAATLVILVGAGLLGRSFLRLVSTNPGFQARNLVTMEFSPPSLDGPGENVQADLARQARLMKDLLARLEAIPGTKSVGLAGALPVAAGDNLADGTFLILDAGKPLANFDDFERMAQNPAMAGHATYCVAGEEYFRATGIPLVRGRMFGPQDDAGSPHVALISETLARQRWPNEDPLGRMLEYGNMDGIITPLTIVGIVGDVRGRGLDQPPSPIVYVHYRQRGMHANASPTIVMRSAAPLADVASAARTVFHDLAPDIPVKVSSFDNEMSGWLSDRRFLLLLVAIFACASLGLAAVGIYGVVAYSVARRTQEIGIRMALGGERKDVLRLVLGEGGRLALLGVAIGIVASLAVTRLLSSLLFGVSATDPVTFGCVAALLALVALLASYIPARRAMRLDPNIALRYE